MDAGFPPDQPAHVIDQVSQSDFRGGPGDPDGAHDQPEAALLGRTHRLNSRAHPRAGSVGPSLHGGEAEPRSAAEVNLRDEAVLLQKRLVGFRAVGRIGPDRAGRVRLVQNRPKLSPVVGCCVRDREPPHEAVGSIDADVVLVAKHRDGNLDPPLPRGLGGRLGPGPLQGPAGIPILLGQPLGLVLPAFWDVARFDRLLLRIRVALLGADHNGGVHNLARHGQVPFCLQGRIEGGEQALDRAGPRQLLAEEPDGLGIWNRMLQPEPKKAHEREAVADLTRRAAKQNSVASSERVYRVWSTTTLNISTGSYGGRPPRVPSERFRAETSGARNTSKSIRVASRISGSPLSDRAR